VEFDPLAVPGGGVGDDVAAAELSAHAASLRLGVNEDGEFGAGGVGRRVHGVAEQLPVPLGDDVAPLREHRLKPVGPAAPSHRREPLRAVRRPEALVHLREGRGVLADRGPDRPPSPLFVHEARTARRAVNRALALAAVPAVAGGGGVVAHR